MSGYPLEAALALRRRQEQAALKHLDAARGRRAAAEARADILRAASEAARMALDAARIREPAGAGVTLSAVEEATRDRFVARLREVYRRARAAYADHAAGARQQARQGEDEARSAHGVARRACEALSLHEGNFRHEERRARDRREEDDADEAARAARHRSR